MVLWIEAGLGEARWGCGVVDMECKAQGDMFRRNVLATVTKSLVAIIKVVLNNHG